MSTRTASLLMLFIAALMATGVVVAVGVAALHGSGAAGPWLVPVVAVVCHTTILFLGRHHILPVALAASLRRAAATVFAMVVVTLAVAWGGIWLLQWLIGRALVPATLTVLVWFVLLWLAVQRQQNWHLSLKSGVR
jgi:hypothetical protein